MSSKIASKKNEQLKRWFFRTDSKIVLLQHHLVHCYDCSSKKDMQERSCTSTQTSNLTVVHLTVPPPMEEEKKVEPKKKPKKPKTNVRWTEDTVDNENMGRLKSNGNVQPSKRSDSTSLLYLSRAQ